MYVEVAFLFILFPIKAYGFNAHIMLNTEITSLTYEESCLRRLKCRNSSFRLDIDDLVGYNITSTYVRFHNQIKISSSIHSYNNEPNIFNKCKDPKQVFVLDVLEGFVNVRLNIKGTCYTAEVRVKNWPVTRKIYDLQVAFTYDEVDYSDRSYTYLLAMAMIISSIGFGVTIIWTTVIKYLISKKPKVPYLAEENIYESIDQTLSISSDLPDSASKGKNSISKSTTSGYSDLSVFQAPLCKLKSKNICTDSIISFYNFDENSVHV